jgi:hypothetical protein
MDNGSIDQFRLASQWLARDIILSSCERCADEATAAAAIANAAVSW